MAGSSDGAATLAAGAGIASSASTASARSAGARIVGRSAFEAALLQRCDALPAAAETDPAQADGVAHGGTAAGADAFTLLLLRLRRSDRRVKLLATEGADPVLREVLQRVAGVLHDADLVTACSRDEIAVLLAKVTQESVARLAIDRVLRSLDRMKEGAALRPQVGAAIAPTVGRGIEQVLSAVDIACEAAGRAQPRIVFGDAEMAGQDDDSHLPLLQRALDSNSLTIAFQPQYDLAQGTWTCMEALIRWPRSDHGRPLSPAHIVDLAERHGLMDGLTRLVLNSAMRQVVALERQGIRMDVAVNLSPSMLADGGLPDRVAQALATWDLPADRLVLEVTENAIIQDAEATNAVMRRLAHLGSRLSIDDFGTGHSSFARLRDMPLAELKIDRLFVASMTARREDLQIVRSAIDLAHNFGLRAVAEGVEDQITFSMLQGMACDSVQGYYCARPMAIVDLLRWWPDRPQPGRLAR